MSGAISPLPAPSVYLHGVETDNFTVLPFTRFKLTTEFLIALKLISMLKIWCDSDCWVTSTERTINVCT